MKTLEFKWYVVIKAYINLPFWRDFVLSHIGCPHYPHIWSPLTLW